LPGFDNFLLPKTWSQLTPAACFGPVVVLNVSSAQCDALILMLNVDNVIHVPLPGFTLEEAQGLQNSLSSLFSCCGRPGDTDHRTSAKMLLRIYSENSTCFGHI
jgi:hypothetical protein